MKKSTYSFRKLFSVVGYTSIMVCSYVVAQSNVNVDYENRGGFNPGTNRETPFEFSERRRAQVDKPTMASGNLGVAETLKQFVIPSGYVSGKSFTDNKIFLGGRFFEVDDIIRIRIQAQAEKYLYPVMEVVVKDISDDYVEFYHGDTTSNHRIPFDFKPDISPTVTSGSSVNGASIEYIGKDALPETF